MPMKFQTNQILNKKVTRKVNGYFKEPSTFPGKEKSIKKGIFKKFNPAKTMKARVMKIFNIRKRNDASITAKKNFIQIHLNFELYSPKCKILLLFADFSKERNE